MDCICHKCDFLTVEWMADCDGTCRRCGLHGRSRIKRVLQRKIQEMVRAWFKRNLIMPAPYTPRRWVVMGKSKGLLGRRKKGKCE